MRSRFRRLLILMLVLALGTVALAACGGDDDSDDVGLGTDEDLVEEPVVEDETDIVDETPVVEETPVVADEEMAAEEEALTTDMPLIDAGLMTSDRFIGLQAVNEADQTIAEIVDAYFDMDGNIRYVMVDLDNEVAVADLMANDNVIDQTELEQLDVVMVDWDLLQVRSGAGDAEAEAAEVDLQAPFSLIFTEDIAAEGIPGVSQEIDAAAVAASQQDIFADTAALGVQDEFAQGELLQVSSFEFFDLTDHDVVNLDGEDLGDIDELVIDILNGQVAYATVDVGGFLGIGENTIAIAWNQFQYETNDQNFVLDVTADDLTAAPPFDASMDTGFFDQNTFTDEEQFYLDNPFLAEEPLTMRDAEMTDEDMVDQDVVDLTFNDLNVNADDVVDEAEFEAFVDQYDVDPSVFDEYDVDGDGLSLEELTDLRQGLGLPVPDTDMQMMEDGTADMDETMTGQTAMANPSLVTSDRFIGLDLVTPDDVQLGEVVDGFFDMDGNIQYIVIDLEEEADVQLETMLGDDTLFDEEVDTVLMSYNLFNLNMDAGDSDDELATADIETPANLVIMEDFGQDVPWVAQEIDAAALEGDQLFLDPARFNVTDEDFTATGNQDLLQISHFEFFDLADHEVVNLAGEDLGDINELIVDLTAGRVAYTTVDVGGFLGIGETKVIVPWDQFSYETADQDFVLDVDQATLEQAPTLDDGALDLGIFDADAWATDIDPYWE